MTRRVILQGSEYIYEYTRKKVKNINLRIKPDMTLHVSLPYGTDINLADEFLIKNGARIIRVLNRYAQSAQSRREYPLEYNGEESVMLFGKKMKVEVLCGPKRGVFAEGDSLFAIKRETDGEQKVISLVKSYLLRTLEIKMRAMASEFYERNKQIIKRPYPQISFRTMKTRWGSCNSARLRITFNYLLVRFPTEAVEYVVAHEFAHLVEANHSPRFYAVLGRLMGDFKARERILKEEY